MSNLLNRLLNPKDFSSAIWVENFISIGFGQLNSSSNTLSIIYGIIIIIVHLSLTLKLSYDNMIVNKIVENFFNERLLIAWLDFFINFILLPVNILSWIIIGRSNYRTVVSSLKIIDKDLTKISFIKLNLIDIVKRQLISFLILIIVYFIVVLKFSYNEKFELKIFCQIFFVHYSLYVRMSICLNFSNIVHFIGERYELVNNSLKFFQSSKNFNTRIINQNYEDNDEKKIFFSSSIIIHNLRIIHSKLYLVSRNILDTFSLILLICLTVSFIGLIIDFYQIYLSFKSSCYKKNFNHISNHFIKTFIDFGCIINVAYECHDTVQKANDTKQIINSMLVNYTEGLRYYEVSTFSDQLMHYRLTFSPFGLFKLDLISQHSMVATISLYLIIIVQLQQSNVEYDC